MQITKMKCFSVEAMALKNITFMAVSSKIQLSSKIFKDFLSLNCYSQVSYHGITSFYYARSMVYG